MSLLVSLLLSANLQSTCQQNVLLQDLDAGAQGPRLWTPKGAPVLGGAFALQVLEGAPAAAGLLGLSFSESPIFLPAFQAIVYPASPLLLPFALDSEGSSQLLVDIPWMDPILCGLPLVAQALVFDAAATGGASFSNGLRLRAGKALKPLYPNALMPTVKSPDHAIAADFDADGQDDLMVVGNGLAVHLGQGHGTFSTTLIPWPGGRRLASGDLDGDGVLDVATVGTSAGLFVLSGLGGGAFGAAIPVDPDAEQQDVFVADLNGDGDQDLLTRHPFAPTPPDLTILLGNGDGTFQTATYVDFADGTPHDVFLADYDSDGVLDVAAAMDTGGVPDQMGMFLGNGDGTLAPYAALYAPTESHVGRQLALTDLDTDGDQDVLLSRDSLPRSLDVLLQHGSGVTLSANYGDVGDYEYVLADMNDDGLTDLIAVGAETAILLGAGDGGFSSVIHAPIASESVAAGDLDGDDKLDLAFPSAGGNGDIILVSRGDGDGTLALTDPVKVPNAFLSATTVADLDGDGAGDLVAIDSGASGLDLVRVALGNGDGSFGASIAYASGADHPVAVQSADFDADGLADVAVAHDTGSAVSVLLGTGGGALAVGTPIPVVGQAADVAAADLNGDGAQDLVAATWITHSLAVLLGNGDGSFSAPAPVAVHANWPMAVKLADLDLDGDLDAAAACANFFSHLSALRGNGDGTFGVPTVLALSGLVQVLDVGDVTSNGIPDVVTGSKQGTLSILNGLGDGSFAKLEDRFLEGVIKDVIVRDLDGDGRRDVFASSTAEAPIALVLLRGLAGGALGPLERHEAASIGRIAVGDLDRDGILDVAVSQPLTGRGWVVRISTVGE